VIGWEDFFGFVFAGLVRLGAGCATSRAFREGGLPTSEGWPLSRRLAQRVGNRKLFANSDCGRVLNLTMSRYRAGALCGRIMVDAVISTLAKQHAAMGFQVADQINALHNSRHGNRDLFAGNFLPAMRLAG
jgi:hypothetical protein